MLDVESEHSRLVFLKHCKDNAEDWIAVLPTAAEWCAGHPKDNEAFDFAVDGFLSVARLAEPSKALALLDALADPTPFETLRDALRAHGDKDLLHRMAPERRAIAIELLERLSRKPAKAPTPSQPK